MTLQNLRNKINDVDRKLVGLLARRMELVDEVGYIKRSAQLPPLDASRWQEVLSSRKEWGSELGLDPSFIQDIFNRIHDYSLQIEGEICQK